MLEAQLDAAGTSAEILRAFGSGQPGLRDGPAGQAVFHSPHGLSLSKTTLYVADTDNHAVRAINLESGR